VAFLSPTWLKTSLKMSKEYRREVPGREAEHQRKAIPGRRPNKEKTWWRNGQKEFIIIPIRQVEHSSL